MAIPRVSLKFWPSAGQAGRQGRKEARNKDDRARARSGGMKKERKEGRERHSEREREREREKKKIKPVASRSWLGLPWEAILQVSGIRMG
jgi:hypothetical protein